MIHEDFTDRVHLQDDSELEIVPDVVEGTCRGCHFQLLPGKYCPTWDDGKLRCAYYTKGPAGVWKEVT